MSTNDERTPRDESRIESQAATGDLSLALIEEQADRSIRRILHDGRMFFSVVDVIGVLTESANPGTYWRVLKLRLKDEEGAEETVTKCNRLRMLAADGKMRLTDAADTETLLRIIQSIPSPKAEPVKQWLARVGAKRLDEVTRPLDAGDASVERAALVKPSMDAPALEWAEYFEHLAALYRRQATYEARLTYVDARLTAHEAQFEEHEAQIGELHSRMESLEEGQRIFADLPELLERLAPHTLVPEHQATVKAMVKRLHELAGYAYGAIYAELNEAFHVGRFSDIPDARWEEVTAWFKQRIEAAEKRQRRYP